MFNQRKISIGHLIRRNKLVTVGIILIVAGLSMRAAAWGTWEIMLECNYPRGNVFPPASDKFEPGSVFTIACDYEHDVGQNLIFWAVLSEDADRVPIPTHVEIRDPNNNVVEARNFDSATVVLYVKPQQFGKYTASITILQGPDDTTPGASYLIEYGFGHLTSGFPGVSNTVGDAIGAMVGSGPLLVIPGLILSIYGLARSAKKKRKSFEDKENRVWDSQ